MSFDIKEKRVFVAGHRGMVGSAVVRRLASEECVVLTADRSELDLRNQTDVWNWMGDHKPDAIIMAAAKVGGINANNKLPAQFISENLVIQSNIIDSAWQSGVAKLLFLGSSCIYPRLAKMPIREEYLLTGPLEPTNEFYAIAKIAGLKLCQAYRKQYGADFISAQPTNLFGVGDNYDLEGSHVAAALLRKFHEAAKARNDKVTVWGTGKPLREFLYVDDLADALVFLLKNYSGDVPLNIGSGHEVSIADLATLIGEVVGYCAEVEFDSGQPDGTPRKLLDSSRLHALGWSAKTDLKTGLEKAYADFVTLPIA